MQNQTSCYGVDTPSTINALTEEINRCKRQFTGFFPTPETLVNILIKCANLKPDMRFLEPNGGMGDIAKAALKITRFVDVVEIETKLIELLRLEGFDPVQADFVTLQRTEVYDRIVMNPPFNLGMDMEHIQHAYTMLKAGGRLVSVVYGQAGEFRNQKHKKFREFLECTRAVVLPAPHESFKDGFNPTKVATKIIVIDKPDTPPLLNQSAINTLKKINRALTAILEMCE